MFLVFSVYREIQTPLEANVNALSPVYIMRQW